MWLFVGPPAFREVGTRLAMASIVEGQDYWNIMRFIWWGMWTAIALYDIFSDQRGARAFLAELGMLPIFVCMWLLPLYASCFISPSPYFSVGNATCIVMLVICSFDLGLKLFTGQITFRRVLHALMMAAGFLLTVISITYLIKPSLVSWVTYTGTRIRGNSVGYAPLCSLILFFVSVFVFLKPLRKKNYLLFLLMGYALFWIYIGQTRSAYAGFGVGAIIYLWQWGQFGKSFTRSVMLFSLVVAAIASLSIAYGASHRVRWEMDALYDRYVLRDASAYSEEFQEETLTSLNGRTIVASVLIRETFDKPLGSGYVSGPRAILQSEDVMYELGTQAFGNAHNAYLEIYTGSGFLAFFGFMGVVIWLVMKARSTWTDETMLIRVLMYAVLLQGLFESNLVLPFKQSSVLFWVLIACVAPLEAIRRNFIIHGNPIGSPRFGPGDGMPMGRYGGPPIPMQRQQPGPPPGRQY